MVEHQGRPNPRSNPFEDQAFRVDLRSAIGVATVEASNRGSAAIEAEHLLLAFLFDRTNAATQALASAGLTYEAFDAALKSERARTLAAIGITLPDPSRLTATRVARQPRFGASAKDVWERGVRTFRGRRGRAQRPGAADFLAAIVSAELGTVPRALVQAGFDRHALLAALTQGAATSS